MLKSMGERTPPCVTPDLNCRFVDVWFLNVVYAMRPLMYFAMYLSMVCGMFVCVCLLMCVCLLCRMLYSCLVLLRWCVWVEWVG